MMEVLQCQSAQIRSGSLGQNEETAAYLLPALERKSSPRDEHLWLLETNHQ